MWAWIVCRIMVLRMKQVFLPVSVVCASITMSWSSAMFISNAATGESESVDPCVLRDPFRGEEQLPYDRYAGGYVQLSRLPLYGQYLWRFRLGYGESTTAICYVSICTGTAGNGTRQHCRCRMAFAIIRGDEKDDGTFNWTPLVGDKEKDKARYTFGIDPERTRSGAAESGGV